MPKRYPLRGDLSESIPVNVNVVGGQVETAVVSGGATATGQLDIIAAIQAVEQNGLTDAQLRATALPVSAASLPLPSGAATSAKQDSVITAIGNLEQNGLTDTQLRASALDVTVSSALPAGSNTIGAVQNAGPSWTPSVGVSGQAFTSADASGSAVAVTDAPATGQKLVIDQVVVSVDTAMSVELREETSGDVLLKLMMAANTSEPIPIPSGLKLATADKKLMVQTSAAGNIAVTAIYHSEA